MVQFIIIEISLKNPLNFIIVRWISTKKLKEKAQSNTQIFWTILVTCLMNRGNPMKLLNIIPKPWIFTWEQKERNHKIMLTLSAVSVWFIKNFALWSLHLPYRPNLRKLKNLKNDVYQYVIYFIYIAFSFIWNYFSIYQGGSLFTSLK